jgi:hypothetical protein
LVLHEAGVVAEVAQQGISRQGRACVLATFLPPGAEVAPVGLRRIQEKEVHLGSSAQGFQKIQKEWRKHIDSNQT